MHIHVYLEQGRGTSMYLPCSDVLGYSNMFHLNICLWFYSKQTTFKKKSPWITGRVLTSLVLKILNVISVNVDRIVKFGTIYIYCVVDEI